VSSRDGWARADVDVGLYDDPKVKALVRLQRDPLKTAATMTLYLATILASWRHDSRVKVLDAAPTWWLDVPDEMIVDLTSVGLLDSRGCVPKVVLDRWMASTRARSEGARAAADARWSDRNANGMRPHSGRNANSLPASQPAGRARARETGQARETSAPRSLKQILAETTGEPNIVKETKG